MEKRNIVIILLVIASGEGLPLNKIYRQYENKQGIRNCYNEVCHKDKAPHASKQLLIPNTQEELAGILNRQVKEAGHSSEELYDSELAFKYDEIVVDTEIRFRGHNDGYYTDDDNADDFDKISDNCYNHKISASNFDDHNEFWDEEEDDDFIGYNDKYKNNNEISFARDDGDNDDDENDGDDDDGKIYMLLINN